MVKADPANSLGNDMSDTLARSLRREGESLLRTQKLIQKTPVTPLQLHRPFQSVDPVLVSPHARVAVLGDSYGQAALAYAGLRPHWKVTGWVPDTKTFMNLQNLATPENLIFDKKPKTETRNACDAILAVAWAHQLFSEKQYHVPALLQGVQELLSMLPEHGQLLIQDFALPEHSDRFVILDVANSEACDALIEFSHTARPHAPKALQGFFIETMASPRNGIKRFRLPIKWAVEFYHRWRHNIAMDVPFELTTLSLAQWSALIEQSGARVTYHAPHYLSRAESKEVQRDLGFADEEGNAMALPAASFTLLIEKIPELSALQYYERRISTDAAKDILISGFKNTQTNEKVDVVEIRHHEDDVLPWYRDAHGALRVLVKTNVARPIINSVPRGTPNLDGRHWAGYLIEPLTVQHFENEIDQKILIENVQRELDLPNAVFGKASVGIEYYPAPDYLVQRVRGILLPLVGEKLSKGIASVKTKNGTIIDVMAEDVLRAISAGLIPDGKLEILIGELMQEMGESAGNKGAPVNREEVYKSTRMIKDRHEVRPSRFQKSGEHLMEYISDTPTERLRAVRSVFVEDQISDYGRHIAYHIEQDFIVPNTLSANTAVCIPLARDPVNGLMMSSEPRMLPIPQRMGTSEPLLQLPSFSLPETVKTVEEARIFLARQLGCEMDDLHDMGHSFFAQPQISAERIYPFLLTAPAAALLRVRWYKPRAKGLRRALAKHTDKTAAYVDYRMGRDYGEWYNGFSPELMNHMKTMVSANEKAAASSSVRILKAHPAAKPRI